MYRFTFKRNGMKKRYMAKGHTLHKDIDRMDIFLADNRGIVSIPKWSECTMFLGPDSFLYQQEQMEEETGQNVKLKK